MSLKQTIPAGSPGHKRRSRWLTGKFLVLFLAVATLLAGTALVAPQFQEKASAIDDGRDITWDVSGGQKAYDAMINAVRQRATGGRVLREGILQTDPSLDPNNPANVFAINLQASALPGSSDANSVRLIMRARDLFVIGYQVTGGRGPTNPHFLRGDAPGGMTGDPLNFTGSYTDLERVGRQERAGLKLTLEGMSTAYRTLRDDANENAVARSLMLFVMTIAEAARFDPLRQNFRGAFDANGGQATVGVADAALMNAWSTASQEVVDSLNTGSAIDFRIDDPQTTGIDFFATSLTSMAAILAIALLQSPS